VCGGAYVRMEREGGEHSVHSLTAMARALIALIRGGTRGCWDMS
jgi:hypothetical protein